MNGAFHFTFLRPIALEMAKTGQTYQEFGQALAGQDLWVFGYGSLMWNPGFAHRRVVPAWVHGYHRAFAMESIRHRGTAARPGLVLTLCPGGSCVGRAFEVPAADVPATFDYLLDREIGTYAYRPALISLRMAGRQVRALTFLPTRRAPQFVPGLSLGEQAARIAHAAGGMGPNPSYLRNTIVEMQSLGLNTRGFEALEQRVNDLRAIG